MKNSSGQLPSGPAAPANPRVARVILALACLLVVAVYVAMADLKGIGTDEGFRLGIVNGAKEYTASEPATQATWSDVLQANNPYAYQPLYFLILNTVMRVGHTHDELVLKYVNVFFLWLSLQGLLALSRGWQLTPRLFLVGVFSLNVYLFMHVLQLREYIVGIAFYVWSSWLVLRLDRRIVVGGWADVGWFSAYGGLLAAGYFTQSWAVFPAVAQGIFLLRRRAGDRLRFYAYLALSYLIVLSLAWPYLQTHSQKVNIGRWGVAGTLLWPRLADGFHFVLSGQSFGESSFADFLFWFWLALLAGGAAWWLRDRARGDSTGFRQEASRQAWLMLLSLGVAVAFQIGYFLKVDTLSVWPRYFALHYFFVIWLVALCFNGLWRRATDRTLPARAQRAWRVVASVVLAMTIGASGFQIRSYYLDPYLDSGLTETFSWRLLSAGLSHVIQPGDTVLTQDFLHAWTLSFTRPLVNPILPIQKTPTGPNPGVKRFVYLETTGNVSARNEAVARLGALGFSRVHAEKLRLADTADTIRGWNVLIFERP